MKTGWHQWKRIAADYRYAVKGCELLLKFYNQLEQHDRANYYLQQYQHHSQTFKTAIKSRLEISADDQFLPHQLSDFMQRQLREHLELYPEITKAYLVQKEAKVLPEQLLYVLVLVRRIVRSPRTPDIDPQISFDRYDRLAQILEQTIDFPDELSILAVEETQSMKLWQTVKRVENALLYRI
jgi:hypothetical protein